jgi:site-specific DNA-methyltransferase (adenine-specific)
MFDKNSREPMTIAKTLAKNQIHQGDCVALLEAVAAGSVDLVFADPPFNIGYDYDVYEDRQETEDYLTWCHQWIGGVFRALKPDGTFWLAIGDEYAAELKIEAQKTGFHCRSWVIWYYTFGVNCANGFSRSHTHLFHFVKDPKKFTFNRANPQIRVKSARQLVYADRRANPDGRLPDNTWITRPQDAPLSFSPSHDTWYFARVAGTFKEREGFHGCQMPEQLLARIIRSTSHPGDLVLDPFSGSGTTLTVAKKLARQWIGFELSQDYVRYIDRRLKNTSVGDPLDGAADPIESAPPTAAGRYRKLSDDGAAEQVIKEVVAQTGCSAQTLLCDPERNAEFIQECSQHGSKVSPYFWNRLLWQMEAAGKLPQPTEPQFVLSDAALDEFGYASEVACRLMEIDYNKSLDEILFAPDAAAEFDRLAQLHGPVEKMISARDLRLAAVTLRAYTQETRQSHKKVPSTASGAEKKFVNARISNPMVPLTFAGVVALWAGDNPVMVLQTANIQQRIEQLLMNPRWQSLGLDSVTYLATEGNARQRLEIQSMMVEQLKPMLNCHWFIATLSHNPLNPGSSTNGGKKESK